MMPQRIQRRRTRGWRMPEGAIYVGRPSRWGNPFRIGENYLFLSDAVDLEWPLPTYREPGDYPNGITVVRCTDAATAVEWYRRWAKEGDYARTARTALAGRDLACWCPLDQPCHADVLLKMANR